MPEFKAPIKPALRLGFMVIASMVYTFLTPAYADSFSGIIYVTETGKETLVPDSDRKINWNFDIDPINKTASISREFDRQSSGLWAKNRQYFKQMPRLFISCDHDKPIQASMLVLEKSTPGPMNYLFSSGSNQQTGSGQLLGNGIALGLEEHGAEIIQALLENVDIKFGFKEEQDVIKWIGFPSQGFAEAFQYSCSTHPNYEALSGQPSDKTFRSVCLPVVRDERCQLASYRRDAQYWRYALEQAIESEDIVAVNSIFEERPTKSTELDYFGIGTLDYLMRVSLQKQSLEITRRLINAGAPAYQAVHDAIAHDDESALAKLVKVGVDLNSAIADYQLEKLVKENKIELVEQLIAGGVDFERPTRDNLSLLMLAIHLQYRALAEKLIPVSNPFHNSKTDTINPYISAGLPSEYWPASNALALAKQATWPSGDQIVAAIEHRADEIDDSVNAIIMYLQTDLSLGKTELRNGNLVGALRYFESGILRAEIPSITVDAQGDHIVTAMNLLFHKHETQMALGHARSSQDIQLADKLTLLGGWFQPQHDMLSVFESAALEIPSFTTDDWVTLHGEANISSWDSFTVEKWIEEQPEGDTRRRLKKVLKFFTD